MSKSKVSIFLCILISFLLIPVITWAGTIQLPQTGQTKCYDTAGTEIPCAGTGQDGEYKAGVAWPTQGLLIMGMKRLQTISQG